MFVTFEGIDGSGKTTQIQKIGEILSKTHNVIITREPGATELGKIVRNILLHENGNMSALAEIFLFMADRAEHIEKIIKPALDNGYWVLCDRHFDSTYAYQYIGKEKSRVIASSDLYWLNCIAMFKNC